MMRHNLDHTKVYLCGQVEADQDRRSWRTQLTEDLHRINPTITVWDPMIKPDWLGPDTQTSIPLNKYNLFGALDGRVYYENEAQRTWDSNKEIRRYCRRLANGCDWMIARLLNRFTWGSIDELEIAIERNIPVLIWYPEAPVGLYGIVESISTREMLPHYAKRHQTELLREIEKIDCGSSQCLQDREKWIFTNWCKVNQDR